MQSAAYNKCLASTEEYKNSYDTESKLVGNPSLLTGLKNSYSELNEVEKNEYKKFIKSKINAFGPDSTKDVHIADNTKYL